METTFTVRDPQGFAIFVYKWTPEQPAKAAVQIAHGAAEHALRYKRFAEFLNQAGYIVYADDHRGHCRTAVSLDQAGIAGPNGWDRMVADLKLITDVIRTENAALPVFLFGHSMGSFMAQQYIQEWGSELAGVVLSGSTGSLGDNLPAVIAAVEQETAVYGVNAPSNVFVQMFGGFSEPFQPVRTGFE